MTGLDELHRPEPPRDRWGRYKLTDPNNKVVGWQRVTTFAKYAATTHSLELWKQRQVARGLAARPDLVALAASTSNPDSQDGKKSLNHICSDAIAAAAADAAANMGTALHAWAEQTDLGLNPTIPAPWDKDIAAYTRTLEQAGIEIIGDMIEAVVTVDALSIAGTFDRIVRHEGRLYVADLKTGKNPAAYPHDICVQLACYANADRLHRPNADGEWVADPTPDVDRERALVIHLRPGTAECDLYWFDISAGWAAAQMSADIRAWQKTKADALVAPMTATRIETATPAETSNPERTIWLRERVANITPEARQRLGAAWPDDIPKGGGRDRTDNEIDRIVHILDQIEADLGEPFGPTDPALTAATGDNTEGGPCPPKLGAELRQRVGQSNSRATVEQWAREAAEHSASISFSRRPTVRRYDLISGALLAAATDGADPNSPTCRAALEHAGIPTNPDMPCGALLAQLNTAQAAVFHTACRQLAEGTATARVDDDGQLHIEPAA